MKKYELVFDKNGIRIRQLVEMPMVGERWVEERIPYEEFGESGDVDLSVKRIETKFEDGTLKEIKLILSRFGSSSTRDKTVTSVGDVAAGEGQEDLYQKAMKKIEEGNYPDYYRTYTPQCFKEGTMANCIWQLIRDAGEISQKELKQKVREKGYNPDAGSFGAIIRVLRDVLEVIEERGRGDYRRFRYVGKSKEELDDVFED